MSTPDKQIGTLHGIPIVETDEIQSGLTGEIVFHPLRMRVVAAFRDLGNGLLEAGTRNQVGYAHEPMAIDVGSADGCAALAGYFLTVAFAG